MKIDLYKSVLATVFALLIIGCLYLETSSSKQYELEHKDYKSISAEQLILNRSAGMVYYEKQPYTGYAIKQYPGSETVAEKIAYLNGIKNGATYKWFRNGELSYEANYIDGKLDGKAYSWWVNGNKRTESNFVNGVSEGIQLQWYKSGSLFKKINLINGREYGLQKSWRENGKLYNNYEAKNGRIFGLKRSKLCFQLDAENITT